MKRNDTVRFTSSKVKIPLVSCPSRKNKSFVSHLTHFLDSFLTRSKSHLTRIPNSPLLCSSSLSLVQPPSSSSLSNPGGATELPAPSPPRSLFSEVLVRNVDREELESKDLEAEAVSALKSCRPNSVLSDNDINEDGQRIMETGYFRDCMPVAVDTLDGIQLVFQVEPNQELHSLVCEGATALPTDFLQDAFRDRYGKVVNVRDLREVINSIDRWYLERGLLGKVYGANILSGGIVKLQVAEAEVNNISVCYLDRETGKSSSKGMTKPETLLRQLTTKKGQVYSMRQGKRDIETIMAMGIMEDVSIIPQPAGESNKVDLIMNVVESKSRGFTAGGGISRGIMNNPLSGLIGSLAYSHKNLFGRNKKLNIKVEIGQVDSIYHLNYTDPWIEGDDKRTSRSIMVQNSRTPGNLVHGNQPGNRSLTINRITAGMEFSRPLRPKWSATAGISFQRASPHDEEGQPIIKDFYSSPLIASGKTTHDDMLLAKFESVYAGSGDHGFSMLVFNMEQGVPVRPEWLVFNRVNARARKGVEIGPALCLLSLSGGHVVGNFSPHEAFPIGGINSVRGYEEGAIGSGRSYVVGSSEISFPMLGPVEGVVFADYGTDLGSGPTVLGDPAGARLKPGNGYGYGFGIRVDSPVGPLRLEYAFNDQHTTRFHFGVGQRT